MVIECPICSYRFDRSVNQACRGCPLGAKCDRICCPNCHYSWLESTSIVKALLGLFKKGKSVGRS